MCAGTIVRELLSCLSFAQGQGGCRRQTTFACTTSFELRAAHHWRCLDFRHNQTGGTECCGGTPSTTIVYSTEQRWHTASDCFRDRHYYQSIFSTQRHEALPIPTRHIPINNLQHVIQFELYTLVCVFHHRHGPYIQIGWFSTISRLSKTSER